MDLQQEKKVLRRARLSCGVLSAQGGPSWNRLAAIGPGFNYTNSLLSPKGNIYNMDFPSFLGCNHALGGCINLIVGERKRTFLLASASE